ncbi:hypothetical protein C0995_001924 [Termitomyces sp. Mi166|nr:hypothetical protein C0995_001924 [Termitomyces sp. Mi166\
MFHENIRVARNHRGFAARAVTSASEVPPTNTAAAENKDDKKDEGPARPGTTDARPDRPDVQTKIPLHPTTTLSVVEPAVPTTSNTVVAASVTTTTPVTTTIPVLPPTTTSSVATPPVATPSTSSSTSSVSIKLFTVTTVQKPGSTSHAATSAQTSASSTPVATGAVSGGAVAGGVVGSLAGLALLVTVVVFVVRRYRKKSLDALVFNASKFRRSALLLNDPPIPPEKEKMQEQRGPRPPSMISRHLNAPAVPKASAASPYSEHAPNSTDPYGHYAATAAQYNVGMYGADGQVTRDPYADIYGANPASGQHASHGQSGFGAPPMQFQFPQRPYHQQQGYQSSFALGAHAPAPAFKAPLPNPFSNAPPSTSASAALTAARTAAQASSVPSGSSHSHSTSDPSSKPEVLQRRPSAQTSGGLPAYEEDPKYANMQRDVKVAPGTLAVVSNDNESSSSASRIPVAGTNTTSNTRRPMSFYDPEDAYGGM